MTVFKEKAPPRYYALELDGDKKQHIASRVTMLHSAVEFLAMAVRQYKPDTIAWAPGTEYLRAAYNRTGLSEQAARNAG